MLFGNIINCVIVSKKGVHIMKLPLIRKAKAGERTSSIKKRFMIFSIVLFAAIFVGGNLAFILSMRQIVNENRRNELSQLIQLERIFLEASVNGEIAIALKMADSALIKRFFLDPLDEDLRRLAFEEIAGYRRAFASNSVFWVNDIDHRFYSDDAYAFTLDPTDPNNYWYLMTLHETESYNFNINYNPDLGVTNLWINAPVFDENQVPIGILGTGIDLSAFIDSIYRGYTGRVELYFFNDLGEITGARDARLVADKVTLDNILSYTGPEILSWVRAHPPDAIRAFSGPEGEIVAAPVATLGWYAVAVQPHSLADYLNTSMTALFLVMMGLIAVIFVIVNLSTRSYLRPLDGMILTLNEISKDWDLMKRLQVRTRDEIGNLAVFFNDTFEKFRELLYGIKGMAFSLSDTGEELSANMDGTNTAIENINTAILHMKERVLTQGDAINNAAGSMEKIIADLDTLNGHINVQAVSVEQSSSAIEEMLTNIKSVTETLVKNSANITSLAESSGAGREDLQKVSTDIQEIAKESEGLLQINSVMQTISSQTNLLAMNAAIEAAHAGESGKGFAVVADEIRKLAENSGKQSKTISVVLKKIKASIDTISNSTAIVMDRFRTIEQEVETVTKQETQIRNAMEKQGTGSRHILDSMKKLNEVTDMVQQASSGMASESREVLKQSGQLKVITAEVAGDMDEMNDSADQIASAVIRAKEISMENKFSIQELGREIAKFKVT